MIAQRYVLSMTWPRTVFVVLAGWMLFVVMDSMESARWLAAGTWSQVALFYVYRAPEVMALMLGPGVVLGALAALGLLNRRAEMAALAAAGRSLRSTALPAVLVVSGAAAVTHAALAEWVIPPMGRQALRLAQDVFHLRTGRFWDFHHRSEWFRAGPIYARAQPAAGDAYERVMGVLVDDELHVRQRLVAARMQAAPTPGDFTLEGSVITTLPPSPAFEPAGTRTLHLPAAAAALSAPMGYPEHFTLVGLVRAIEKREAGGRDATAYRLALLRRVTDPMMVFLLGLLAVPLAARQRREAPVERLLFVGGIAVAGAQLALMLADMLAGRALLPSWLAAGLGPGLALVAALLLWRRAEGAKVAR
ncbi:MAG: LptF/LptG family permease [Deltaproteobacteria bacterium]|nr:LptF/LptG family permease [Deltaproteobacteria bacterium]